MSLHNPFNEIFLNSVQGEAGTGNVVEAVRHARTIRSEIQIAQAMREEELYSYAKKIQVKQYPVLMRIFVLNTCFEIYSQHSG